MERVKITSGTIVLTITLIIAVILAYFARNILITSLIGLGIGALISPLLKKLRTKFNMPRALSALIVFFGILLVVSGILMSIYFLVSDQFNSLAERSPQIYQNIEQWIVNLFERYPWIKEQIQEFDIGKTAQQSAMNLLKGFRIGFIAISGAIFALLIGLYTAVHSKEYFDSAIEAFPPKYRNKATDVLISCAQVLQDWFKAQLLDMVIIGVITALGLWLCNVQYWAVFGLLTAVMGIIPYVGIILVVLAASLITLASDPSQIVWVLLVFGTTQQLEGNVIIPLVMKGKVKLPEVPLLIFMLILGNFFGILGVFIAPPLFAILRTIYIQVYLPYIEKT